MASASDMISFSALADYWCCPRLYHYRHELNLPAPLTRHDEAAREGSRIHAWLDLHARGLTPPMATDPVYGSLWQAYLTAIAPYAGCDCKSEWACNVPIAITAETLWLHGRLDRVYRQDQTLVILDFKTGEGEPGPLESLQLDFYAWLLWHCREQLGTGITRIDAIAVWLRVPGQSLTRSLSADGVAALTAEWAARLEAMLGPGTHDVPAPRYLDGSPWCTMCEYQRLCPEGIHHAR